jgi:hypothetical protein
MLLLHAEVDAGHELVHARNLHTHKHMTVISSDTAKNLITTVELNSLSSQVTPYTQVSIAILEYQKYHTQNVN